MSDLTGARYVVPYEQATCGKYVWHWGDAVGETPDEAVAAAHCLMARSTIDAAALVGLQGI